MTSNEPPITLPDGWDLTPWTKHGNALGHERVARHHRAVVVFYAIDGARSYAPSVHMVGDVPADPMLLREIATAIEAVLAAYRHGDPAHV